MSKSFEGGCFCRKARYRLTSEPLFVHCCHCLNCQSQTGSAFVLNALIETDRIEQQSGELTVTTLESGSGQPHDVYRCSSCKTAVWSDYGRRPERRFVRTGTLDDPSALPPDVHIFTKSFEVFYDVKELWPAESLERIRAARG